MRRRNIFTILASVIPSVLFAQVSFTIPIDSITDYQQYDRMWTCNALKSRMNQQLKPKMDSAAYRTRIFRSQPPDTTHPRIQWSLHQCMDKFGIGSIAKHDSILRGHSVVGLALRLYYAGGHYDRFMNIVPRVMRNTSPADTGFLNVIKKFSTVDGAIKQVRPVNWVLLDSLQDEYVVPHLLRDPNNISGLKEYYEILYSRVNRVFRDSPEAGLEGFRQFAAKIRNETLGKIEGDSSYAAFRIRGLLRMAYDKINYAAALDSLRIGGPDGYFNAYQVNHLLAGFTGKRKFDEGVTKEMITPQAFVVYQHGQEPWKSVSTDSHVVNQEFPLLREGKPYVFLWMDALCRKEHQNLKEGGLRNTLAEECWNKYEWIKWFTKEYPSIPVTILTATTGHYSELATTDPLQEAEFIKNAWWNFHHLKANILVYYVNYFNIQDTLDRRREDIVNDNKGQWLKLVDKRDATGRLISDFGVSLVGPDGRVVATMPSGGNAVRESKEILDAFQAWYTQPRRKTASVD